MKYDCERFNDPLEATEKKERSCGEGVRRKVNCRAFILPLLIVKMEFSVKSDCINDSLLSSPEILSKAKVGKRNSMNKV